MAISQVQVLLAVREVVYSASLAQSLMQAGAAVSLVQVRSTEHLLEQLADRVPSLLVLELDAECRALEQLRARYPHLPVVVLLSKPSAEIAFAVSRLGAEDVWTLPPDEASIAERSRAILDRLRTTSANCMPALSASAMDENSSPLARGATGAAVLSGNAHASLQPPLMVGQNPRMAEILDTIEKVAGTDVTVLIRGESGVGKEIIARLLFENSRRRQKPYVKVNCAAIPNDLLESELFGYEAGAFTGANRDKPGKFELADHGTLFLDEIAEMHPMLQAKLLHILQDGRFSRLGAKRDISVDVRVVCATNKPLEQRVREGLFREDLLYRINVVTIFVPPLRERRDEIPILTQYLLRKYAAQYRRTLQPFSPEVMERMMDYEWPGNIRELENLCKRFVLVGSQTQILRELSERHQVKVAAANASKPSSDSSQEVHDRVAETANSTDQSSFSLLEIGRRAAWEAERRAILGMLEQTRWNRREAARRLQVSYKALLNKIKQMNLEDKDLASGEKNNSTFDRPKNASA